MCVCVSNSKFRFIKSHLLPALHPGRSGFCDSLTLRNKALGSFETPITGCIYQSTRHYIAEDLNLHLNPIESSRCDFQFPVFKG